MPVLERIDGPFLGYYVASYASPDEPAGSGGYVGYAKVCTARPSSYWEAAACVVKLAAADGFPSPPQAIDAAIERARRQILAWAHLIELESRHA